ncbi:hypothetical protein CRG98_030585 [Punica granatum]|uniref:Uncharacterized protein n=1 Tax=Punica granatum TaxID=22663 RepID=A0A2I0IYC7_PUNGR|nr:hypothetical protein CRG98_030585 [Punica granatum]
MDTGDGSGHRRRFNVVDLGLTRVKTVGIGGNFAIFRQRFLKSTDLQISKMRANFPFFLAGFCSPSPESTFCPFNFNFIPFSVKISADLAEIAKIAIWGFLGR